MKFTKKYLLFIVTIVLIAVTALGFSACKSSGEATNGVKPPTGEITKLGTGKLTFNLEVKGYNGESSYYEISTDKTVLADALIENKLVSGKQDSYGFMIDTVNGVRADYNKDKAYWSLMIDGEYATTGVSQTEITNGESYGLYVVKC